MRLLDVRTYKLRTFYGDQIPPYAILSHTWLQDHEEVTFAHLQQSPDIWNHLPGARKLKLMCQQAAIHGHSWAWIDTCCIDKTNSSELSEAINSMFRWYRMSMICYAFLTDVDLGRQDNMLQSRWWTRAWTLQELLAPEIVQSFDINWRYTGSKADDARQISHATNIDIETLKYAEAVFTKSVAQRMSWASTRQATREEDMAYSLLGIFQINMTMQYGEGYGAFVRLQKEIMHSSEDLSLFAWGVVPETLATLFETPDSDMMVPNTADLMKGDHASLQGMFASHPSDFAHCEEVESIYRHNDDAYIEEKNGTFTLHAPMIPVESRQICTGFMRFLPTESWIAVLPCKLQNKPRMLLGLLLLLSPTYHGVSEHLKETFRLRSMRSALRLSRLVATFLVTIDTLGVAKPTNMIVEPRISFQHPDAGRKPLLQRTVTIKTKARQVSKISLVSSSDSLVFLSDGPMYNKSGWQTVEKEPYPVLTLDDRAVEGIALELKYETKNCKHEIYLRVWLCNKPGSLDRVFIIGRSPSTVRTGVDDVTRERSTYRLPGKNIELFVNMNTNFIYNQAVSTLSIFEETIRELEDDSEGSNDSMRAMRS